MKFLIAFGSNINERLNYLVQAKSELRQLGKIIKCSSIYETPPLGGIRQNDFLNALCELQTELNPLRLLRKLKIIETKIGRKRSFHWGPREIDLDIIDWNGEALSNVLLKIPHPGLEERAFVLYPLKEINENYVSRSGKSIETLIKELPNDELKLFSSEW